MILVHAIRKAEILGGTHVFQLSKPAIKRGIRTTFSEEDHEAIDWQVVINTKENYVKEP